MNLMRVVPYLAPRPPYARYYLGSRGPHCCPSLPFRLSVRHCVRVTDFPGFDCWQWLLWRRS